MEITLTIKKDIELKPGAIIEYEFQNEFEFIKCLAEMVEREKNNRFEIISIVYDCRQK